MSIRLITNPADDGSFRRMAEGLVAEGADTPQELQTELTREYPQARVVTGITEQDTERWYAYREGRWVRRAEFERTG